MRGIHPALVQWLELRIRRGHEVEDALSQLAGQKDNLKKPMRVKFVSEGVDEEGEDQGGVRKEFFQIVTRAVFDDVWARGLTQPVLFSKNTVRICPRLVMSNRGLYAFVIFPCVHPLEMGLWWHWLGCWARHVGYFLL
jgi:hypothetical protein